MSGMMGNIQPGGSGAGGSAFSGLGTNAASLSGTGQALSGMGVPQLQQAGGYFSSLAGGNRAQMTQTLAPDIQNINAVYGGTARSMSRFLRGPTKDTQLAETDRQRAGQIGNLFSGGRMQANSALAGMGGANVSQGTAATSGGGSLFSSQAGLGQAADVSSAQNSQAAGQGFGGLLFNLLKTFGPKIAGGAVAGPVGAALA